MTNSVQHHWNYLQISISAYETRISSNQFNFRFSRNDSPVVNYVVISMLLWINCRFTYWRTQEQNPEITWDQTINFVTPHNFLYALKTRIVSLVARLGVGLKTMFTGSVSWFVRL